MGEEEPAEGKHPAVAVGGDAARRPARSANPVLVTGSHRSGTTFVGKMLAASPAVAYLREPFGLHHRPGMLAVRFPWWFPYVCPDNEAAYVGPVADMLRFRYRTAAALRAVRTPKDAALVLHDRRGFAQARRRGARPLLKDPIAVFSAGWLAQRFGVQPIVLIRHPAGFASSLMRYGWRHPFDHFSRQPLLIRDHLSDYADQIDRFARTEQPIIDQAILLWNLIHHMILGYRRTSPGWGYHRHEDVAREPVATFATMYAAVGLSFGDRERRTVEEATSGSNPAEGRRAGTIKRDSRAAAASWRTRLSTEEIARIRAGTEPIARAFYADDDW
jgi:Sulfotransferase family